MRNLAKIAMVGIGLGTSAAALAQSEAEGGAGDQQEGPEIETVSVGEEIVVTGFLRQETFIDVPAAITVFDEQLITDAEIDEIADFARLTPGLTVIQGFQNGNRPTVLIRGIGQIGGAAPAVLQLMDGVYLPAGDPLRNSLYDIQRIEVLKGPQGAIYGRDTIGGVINVVTAEPTDDFSGKAEATYGTGDTYSVAGIVNAPLSDGLSVRLSARHLESDGYFVNLAGAAADFRNEDTFRGRVLFDKGGRFTAEFRVGLSQIRNGPNTGFFSSDADTYLQDVGNVLNIVDFADGFIETETFDAALKLSLDFGFASLTSVTQYVDRNLTLVQDGDFGLAPGLQVKRASEQPFQSLSQEFRLVSASEKPFRWIVGVFYEDNDSGLVLVDEEFGLGLGELGRISSDAFAERFAAFGQLEVDLTDRLSVRGTLRYDKDERKQRDFLPVAQELDLSFDRVTPQASILYNVTDDVSLYAGYSEGFRSAGFDQSSGLPFGTEELASYEFGAKGRIGDITFDAAVFTYDYDNQQVATVITDPRTGLLITSTSNLGASKAKGLEALVAWSPTRRLQLRAGLDVLDTEIKADPVTTNIGNRTPYSVKYRGSASAQYRYPVTNDIDLLLRSDFYRQGSRVWDKANTLKQRPFNLVSVRAALESESWSLAVSGENVFDKAYNDQIFVIAPGLNFTYPGRPATWRVTGQVRF